MLFSYCVLTVRSDKVIRRLLAAVALLVSTLAAWSFAGEASAASPTVDVFPIPGSRVASPSTQIAFRGIPPSALGGITVRGSTTGVHAGRLAADSDGRGLSFLPSQRFAAGEVVTVSTSLNIAGARNGTFQFTIASPAGGFGPAHWPPAARVANDQARFRSRPDLAPATLSVNKLSHGTAPGFIFVAPQWGPTQDGPMILDAHGNLVWFKPLPGDDSAADFRVQSYHGSPVLTWWQGYMNAGIGVGQDVIYNSSYQQVATVNAANGLRADLHEFQLTPQNTALITTYFPVYWNASSVHGSKHEIVLDSVVQEIDIPTGLVLFQWDSLDHIPVSDTYEPLPGGTRSPFDYFHANSVEVDHDGNLIISARNTWAAYKVNRQTGALIWRLGGRHSSFKLAPGTYWAFQHDVRVRANNDMFVTLFDDDAGPPTVHTPSRAIKLFVDLKHMTARQVSQHVTSPAVSSSFEGNFQQLSNRDDFIGWGQAPYISEYAPNGSLLFEAHFNDANSSYRAYKFAWSGTPNAAQFPPAVAASRQGKGTVVYASWNGATHIRSWRVLGGSSPSSLGNLGTATKGGFETAIKVGTERYVAVQALDWSGQVMGTSPTVPVS